MKECSAAAMESIIFLYPMQSPQSFIKYICVIEVQFYKFPFLCFRSPFHSISLFWGSFFSFYRLLLLYYYYYYYYSCYSSAELFFFLSSRVVFLRPTISFASFLFELFFSSSSSLFLFLLAKRFTSPTFLKIPNKRITVWF